MKRKAAMLFLVIALIVGGGTYLLRQQAEPGIAAPSETTIAQAAPVQATASLPNAPDSEANAPPAAEAQKPEPLNPFAVRTWEPPRPVVQVVTAPPPPQAPPLPFRFLGRVHDPERGNAFMLSAGERVLSVKTGDVLDGQYLVEEYRDGQLHFLYQPMNIRQTLFVGHDS
ncbi:MAG: hypothetical protein JNK59_04470 [Sterolibacteriaceae bacterium]|jgi:hypothetical protein|nr:hypothetical protein [Sterolibacteriaceae bacterium]